MKMKPDFFKDVAGDWDKANTRVNNARNIAKFIVNNIDLKPDFHLLDFGAGTGLLSEGMAHFVKKITAMDYSEAMLGEFLKKKWPCEVDAIQIDLQKATIDYRFDGIISSMTLHHIQDISLLFNRFHDILNPGGFVALADLEKEDGSFHSNNRTAGVEHFGFDKEYITSRLKTSGFINIEFSRAHTIHKQVGEINREYPIFLTTAYKVS